MLLQLLHTRFLVDNPSPWVVLPLHCSPGSYSWQSRSGSRYRIEMATFGALCR